MVTKLINKCPGKEIFKIDNLHLCRLLQVDSFCQSLSEIRGYLREIGNGAFLDEALSVYQMTSDVGDEAFACSFVQNVVPESGWLAEVVFIAGVETVDFSGNFVRLLQVACSLSWLWALKNNEKMSLLCLGNREVKLITFERVRVVVWCSGLVVVEGHWPVTLVILDLHLERTVHWDLQVVCSQSVTMGVSV